MKPQLEGVAEEVKARSLEIQRQRLLAKIIELASPRYQSLEQKQLFQKFIEKLGKSLCPKRLDGLSNIRLQGESIFFELPLDRVKLVLPGKENPFGSVTGNYLSMGGWGTPEACGLGCPKCGSPSFVYYAVFAEGAENLCKACGYTEFFCY